MSQESSAIVVDRAKSQWSDLWKKEDYWAIWIGFFILIVASCLVFGGRQELESKYEQYAAVMKAESAKPFKTIESGFRGPKRASGTESGFGQAAYQSAENTGPLAVQSPGRTDDVAGPGRQGQ